MRRLSFLLLMILLTQSFAWGTRPTMAGQNECGDATSFDFPSPALQSNQTYNVTGCVPAGKCVAGSTSYAGLFFCHEKAESKCSSPQMRIRIARLLPNLPQH